MGKMSARLGCLAVLACAACVSPAPPPTEPLPVPFVVSDYYSPDGFWGDGETRGSLDVQRTCPDVPAGAAGDCYAIRYLAGAHRFAGVNWQYPHNNWGFDPGRHVRPGANRITFSARGAAGGEQVGFSAGQTGTANLFNDSFSLSAEKVTLTGAWTDYTVLLRGESYDGRDGLIGAFVVSLAAPSDDRPVVFYLTNLRWVP
jgi:hypothetical protein